MSLFPYEDVLTREIESWKGFAKSLLTEQDTMLYMKMLNDCYKYATAINAKGQPFPTESLIIALLFSQHRLIEWLEGQINFTTNKLSLVTVTEIERANLET